MAGQSTDSADGSILELTTSSYYTLLDATENDVRIDTIVTRLAVQD
jgi:hypothetical protein